MAVKVAVLIFALSLAALCSGQLSLRANNVTVANGSPAVLNCTLAGYDGAGELSITVSKVANAYQNTYNSSSVNGSYLLIQLEAATYSNHGQYICTATLSDVQTISTSFYVAIQGYEAPRKQSTGEFGLVRTSERTLVSCPIVGVPGPVFFLWERGEELVNRTGYERVTTELNVTSGPFVNEQGQLDLSRATEEDTMFYQCTGVDVAGGNASQLFRIEVIVPESFVLWIQWYMILVYCVVGVVIVLVLTLVTWFFCANRQECCVAVTKREVVKTKVKREVIQSQFQTSGAQKLDLDNTFLELYHGSGGANTGKK